MLHSIDGDGHLLSVSDRWLQRLGYTAEEVLGRHVTDFLTEESRRRALDESLPRFFATGAAQDEAEQLVAKDGSVVDVLLSATSERDHGGNVIRSLAVLVDVAEQAATARTLAGGTRPCASSSPTSRDRLSLRHRPRVVDAFLAAAAGT